jgi:1-phosphatidylinositol-4-phosphate 5-kinase
MGGAAEPAASLPHRSLNHSGNRGGAAAAAGNARSSSASGLSNSSGGDRKYDKICIWESDGDITCDIVDGAALADEAVGPRRSIKAAAAGDGLVLAPPSPAPRIAKWVPPREAKRQGETIAKGHKNYELMLNLQLGIRCVSSSFLPLYVMNDVKFCFAIAFNWGIFISNSIKFLLCDILGLLIRL